jgi:hypothetical protein
VTGTAGKDPAATKFEDRFVARNPGREDEARQFARSVPPDLRAMMDRMEKIWNFAAAVILMLVLAIAVYIIANYLESH